MSLFRRIITTLAEYGPKSSVHGFYHIYRSNNKIQQSIWLLIFTLFFGLMAAHSFFAIQRYSRMGTFVHMADEADTAQFPAVTICSLKPIASSVFASELSGIFLEYLKNNWEITFSKQFTNDTTYQSLGRFMEMFYATEDTYKVGLIKSQSILYCDYQGFPCDHNNFTLVRDPVGWNCYSFVASANIAVGTDGLRLLLFTDTSLNHSVSDKAPISAFGLDVKDLFNKTNERLKAYRRTSWKLDQSGAYEYPSDGIRVILHSPSRHPTMTSYEMNFGTGTTSVVTVNPMLVKRLHRTGVCMVPPISKVEYAVGSESGDDAGVMQAYNKERRDRVLEVKQQIVYKKCGCYSHRYPFQDKQSLCYNVAQERSLRLAGNVIKRMDCHDRALDEADSQTDKLLEKFRQFSSCDSTVFTISTNSYDWPTVEDIPALVNKYLIKRLTNASKFSHSKNSNVHKIFNLSDSNVERKLAGIKSREEAILASLFQDCKTKDGLGQPSKEGRWCLRSREVLKRNIIQLIVKLWRPKARQATENPSFEWPEVLSELGGLCGLWLGYSIISIFELVEAAWEIISPSPRPENDTDSQQDSSQIMDPDVKISFSFSLQE